MGIFKYISLAILVIFSGFGTYKLINQKLEKQFIETQIRKDFSTHLKTLDPINYTSLIGYEPKKELLHLGRMLFNDPILSRNNDVSCATCHLTNHGFADGNFLSVGSMGIGGPSNLDVGKEWAKGKLSANRELNASVSGYRTANRMFRNTLSTVNVAYRTKIDNSDGLFNDGRFGSLFFQALMPIHTDLELCGSNPVPIEGNIFEQGGPLFHDSVLLTHANTFDPFQGQELGEFNAVETTINGVPTFRPIGVLSIPGRNECLAIAIAKIRSVGQYRKLFKEAYDSDEITDQKIAIALSSFMLTHVSKNTPYDRFVRGESSLTPSELKGMISFFTPIGESYKLKDQEIKGGGCFKCHDAPEFGGHGFANLGVRSDEKSTLTKVTDAVKPGESFFGRNRLQRGHVPNCHIVGVTATSSFGPDIGRANATFQDSDCFKFRVPPLRNVMETYPYFHHGSARAQGSLETDYKKRSLLALKQVVKYHLRGPIDTEAYASNKQSKVFYDILEQKDYFVPAQTQNFIALDPNDPQHEKILDLFPVEMPEEQIDDLVAFISTGLYDKNTVKVGDLGNDVTHPDHVPSGFSPTITREMGNQTELPPNRD